MITHALRVQGTLSLDNGSLLIKKTGKEAHHSGSENPGVVSHNGKVTRITVLSKNFPPHTEYTLDTWDSIENGRY